MATPLPIDDLEDEEEQLPDEAVKAEGDEDDETGPDFNDGGPLDFGDEDEDEDEDGLG